MCGRLSGENERNEREERKKLFTHAGDERGRVATIEIEANANRRVTHRVSVHAGAVAWPDGDKEEWRALDASQMSITKHVSRARQCECETSRLI